MSNEKMFSKLVENSLNFLNKAIAEIDEEPFFSLIHFYTGLELLLKARLMHEHWSLIVSRKNIPDLQKFNNGDFQSINLDEILDLLDKTLGIKIAKAHADTFHSVRRHRNRIMHFFHDAQTERIKKESIIQEQLVAWYFLQIIITTQWTEIFEPWSKHILKIDKKLRGYRSYLNVIFSHKLIPLKKLKTQGFKVETCPSCKFKSLACSRQTNILYQAKCEVCNLSEPRINLSCPHCTKIITYKGEVTTHCTHCKKRILPEDVAHSLLDLGDLHIKAMEGDFSDPEANCVECDGYHTVINTKHSQLICTSCLSEFENIYQCEWCGESHTKHLDNSYYEGCGECHGASDWQRDD
jgi:acyl carrier protein